MFMIFIDTKNYSTFVQLYLEASPNIAQGDADLEFLVGDAQFAF